jgi:hypothetical protein
MQCYETVAAVAALEAAMVSRYDPQLGGYDVPLLTYHLVGNTWSTNRILRGANGEN